MPRRRMRFYCSARWVSKSAIVAAKVAQTAGFPRTPAASNTSALAGRKFGEDGLGREYGVAHADLRTRARREVDVDARAEADESEALATRQYVAGLRVTEYASRDQTGDLHDGDVLSCDGTQVQRVALVLDRCFVERRVE